MDLVKEGHDEKMAWTSLPEKKNDLVSPFVTNQEIQALDPHKVDGPLDVSLDITQVHQAQYVQT